LVGQPEKFWKELATLERSEIVQYCYEKPKRKADKQGGRSKKSKRES
jgi:hypothetical protein